MAHGLRTPGTIRYTTFWLFHRNCPPGTASESISSSSSSTSGFQAVFLPGGKPFFDRCHFWPSTFQGITSSGFVVDALGEFLEAGDGPLEERPERRRIDFLPRVGVDLHFLPGAAERFALHARAAAVGFDFVDVVERLEVEVGDQLVAVEGFLRGAEFQFHQPAFAGDGVEEPAVGFFRGR